MVKSVIGEESRLKLVEDRLSQSSIPAQVGLLIGRLSSSLDRGFVFDLVPTPLNDAGEPACSVVGASNDDRKRGPKLKSQAVDSSSLEIDEGWVAEHARQVSRMLLGGIKVIGIYVWVGDGAFKNSTITLCKAVKAVADAAPLSGIVSEERILLHISYSPRRWTCRNCILASNITSNNLWPCDFKMGKVLNSLQTFKCMYNFDLRLPVYKSSSNVQTLIDVLRHGISLHAKDLTCAKATVDGNLITNDEPCTSDVSSDGLHEVELFLPVATDASIQTHSHKGVSGVISFGGSVCSFAYVNLKEPISQAIADIKDDIITSLQSRLDIISDEADEDSGLIDAGDSKTNDGMSTSPVSRQLVHLLRKTCNLSFPRRVFVPWLAGILVCDYLQSPETLEALKDHCVELLSMEAGIDNSTILEPEVEALALSTTRSFWDVAASVEQSSKFSSEKNGCEAKSTKTSSKIAKLAYNINIMFAALFLLLAFVVGFVVTAVRRS